MKSTIRFPLPVFGYSTWVNTEQDTFSSEMDGSAHLLAHS